MKYLTEDLYKKYQLFQLPVDDGITLEDLEDLFEIDAHEFLLQELLARDEWYNKYLPEPLHSRLFDKNGEVSFQELDDSMLEQIRQFRSNVEFEWAKASAKAKQERQQIKKTALPELRKLLDMDLADSEIRTIKGIDTAEVTIELYPQWDLGKIITLQFKGVKGSWASKFHPDDANWWLVDEITADEERADAYMLYMLFGNADFVGQVQFSFTEVVIRERNDLLGF